MPTPKFFMAIKTRRILLVNCDRAIEEMMQLCLETIYRCEVVVVNSGIRAVEEASIENIDAILLYADDRALEASWSRVIEVIKQNPSTSCIPLILLTSTPQDRDLVELQRIKRVEAIALSFDLSNLANQISTLLDWD